MRPDQDQQEEGGWLWANRLKVKRASGHRLQSVILCVITQTEVCATLPRLPFQLRLTKSLAVLERGDERLDHFSIDVIAAKLIQLAEPEVIAAQVCIR
jgi:hypothetical protein